MPLVRWAEAHPTATARAIGSVRRVGFGPPGHTRCAPPPPAPSRGMRKLLPIRRAQVDSRRDMQLADISAARHPGSTAYAALDLGTNNCRLLVGTPVAGGFRVLESFSRVVRLGEGLQQSGRLSAEAMDRAMEALQTCADRLSRRRMNGVRAIATEACRRAANTGEFVARVARQTGLQLDVITPPGGGDAGAGKLRPLAGRRWPPRPAVRHRRRLDGARLGPADAGPAPGADRHAVHAGRRGGFVGALRRGTRSPTPGSPPWSRR